MTRDEFVALRLALANLAAKVDKLGVPVAPNRQSAKTRAKAHR